MKLPTIPATPLSLSDRPIRKPRKAQGPKRSAKPLWNLWEDGVTQSSLAVWLACPEKFRLRFIEGLDIPSTGLALSFGDLWHRALEKLYSSYRDPSWEKRLPELTRSVVAELEVQDRALLATVGADAHTEEDLEMRFYLLEALIEPYALYWVEEFRGVEWVSLEEEFCVPHHVPGVEKPLLLRGKIDGVLRMNGRLWMFETKTKGQINEEPLVEHLPLDMQLNMYAHARQLLTGDVFEGVVYNVVRRPQLRQGKAETLKAFSQRVRDDVRSRPDHYFLRLSGAFDPEDQISWLVDFNEILRQFVQWFEDRNRNYKNPFSCITAWGSCPYLRLCARQDMSGLSLRASAFPELDRAAASFLAETPKGSSTPSDTATTTTKTA